MPVNHKGKLKILTAYSSNFKSVGNIDVIKIFEPGELETYRIQQKNDFPHNRDFYCTAQGGEFIDWIECEPDEIICFCDSDIIQQRNFSESELTQVTPKMGEFIACYNTYPPLKLKEVHKRLKPKYPQYDKPGVEFQAGVLIAHYADWVRLKKIYLDSYKLYCDLYKHHAMTQFLINEIVQRDFVLKIAPDWLHNGYWLEGTKAHKKREKMWTSREVIFNHFKGVEDFK